ncbi:ADP-ribosylation factor-like protein 6-interacting protein 1 [Babylonia areolata]|uniref:ADP-ribosylation factor-like protein 6-interacting protein 1 n=1 Tax=Babylonia areolata TaxID=304850 RepID=UPI003FD3F9A7
MRLCEIITKRKMAGKLDVPCSLAVNEPAHDRNDLDELKRDLEGWRQVLLHLQSVLKWERPYHPVVLLGAVTLVFVLVWALQPSIMTTVGVLGLVITTVDFAVLFVSPTFLSTEQWTGREEQEFENICGGILQLRIDILDFIRGLAVLKEERPTIYFILAMALLTVSAWIGYIMNNLFLTYLIVLMIVMAPGLRHRGLIHKYLLKYWLFFKRLVFGRQNITKTKVN